MIRKSETRELVSIARRNKVITRVIRNKPEYMCLVCNVYGLRGRRLTDHIILVHSQLYDDAVVDQYKQHLNNMGRCDTPKRIHLKPKKEW